MERRSLRNRLTRGKINSEIPPNDDNSETFTKEFSEEVSDDNIIQQIEIIKRKVDLIYKKYGQIGLTILDKEIIELVKKLEVKLTESIFDSSSYTKPNIEKIETTLNNVKENKKVEIKKQKPIIKEKENSTNTDELPSVLQDAAKMLVPTHKTIVSQSITTINENDSRIIDNNTSSDLENQIKKNALAEEKKELAAEFNTKNTSSAEDQGDPAYQNSGNIDTLLQAAKMFKK